MQQGILYVNAQLGGAILATLLLAAVIPSIGIGNDQGIPTHALGAIGGTEISAVAGLVVETILTFILVFVVVSAAMDPRGVGNLGPLVIGLAVLIDQLIGIPLTGASMNPARSFGPALVANSWSDHWIYWLGPFAGSTLAALTYKYIFEKSGNAKI